MSGKGKRPGEGDTFERKTFSVSRLADFATIPELIKQTGQPVENWLLAIVKELVDNALDEAEAAGTAPEIEIVVTDDSIMIADRGRGIAPALVKSLVDYSVRTSSNAAYVSPTRGQQGNALQSILPMGFALGGQGEDAAVLIESQGVRHHIRFSVDAVRQTPVVSHVKERSAVKIGTRVTVRWPNSPRSTIAAVGSGFLSLADNYGWLNPHLNLSLGLADDDDEPSSWEATNPGWTKWRPSQPTSPHWYDEARLSRLMAAYIADAEDRHSSALSVRDFIRLFRGLSGTAKINDICEQIGVAEREALADFFKREGMVPALFAAMRRASQPVKPKTLGVIGEEHLRERMIEDNCDLTSFVYRKREIEHDGLPYVIEAAFGYRSDDDEAKYGLRGIEGFNFSPAIGGSPFQLEQRLANNRVEDVDPVTVFLHLTAPRLDFLDRGKAKVSLPNEVASEVAGLVKAVTAKWTKQKTAEIRSASAALRRWDAMSKRERPTTIKDAAYAVMVEAYTQASDDGEGGTLPVKPRQIMYRARGSILETTGKETFDDDYFTQEILVDFMRDNPELTTDWDVIWDDRGHFAEPHTGHDIGLGTLPVREYIEGFREPVIEPVSVADAHVSTFGPAGRYHAVLFVEKEGFEPIFQAAGVYERYDLAPSSSKGMSNTATRTLVEELCGKRGLPLFVLHDFDKAGFSIHQTLVSDTDRYQFERPLENVVELGLRLADVERLGLQSERVAIKANEKNAARKNLRDNGATEREIAFLIDGLPEHDNQPRRVELNALTSRQLVDLVEAGLIAHGVGKVTPPQETLAGTYAAFKRGAMAKAALEAELARLNAEPVDAPDDIVERVRAYLVEHREETWDDAVRAVMDEER